ncbi:MAG: hypothetical protein IT460_11490 [Planctomycetes bacterium]|nr:hypothetical protein [Planctomycetota bacterium]
MPQPPPPTPVPLARRVPWALVPLALALLYAGVHAFVGRRPTLEAMVPEDAFVVWRYRDLEAYDLANAAPAAAGPTHPASEVLGVELNVPGLPGVARDRTVVEATMWREALTDARFFVLPVQDGGALARRFADPDLPERHARHLEVMGPWAAAGADRRAVRAAGHGAGPLPPLEEGALWTASADWGKLVEHALRAALTGAQPYADAVLALGARFPTRRPTAAPGAFETTAEGGRVPFVHDAWTRVTVTAWPDRVRATLVPAAASELTPLLARLAVADPAASPAAPAAPDDAEAWLSMRGPEARKATALALWYAGLAWPEPALRDGFAALHLDAPGSLTLVAMPSPGLLPTWTILLAGERGAVPDLAAFGLPAPADEGVVDLPASVGRLFHPFGPVAGRGEVLRRPLPGAARDRVVVGAGPGAETIVARATASMPDAAPSSKGTIAVGGLKATAARRVLGRAVERGGLFGTLTDADLAVSLSTDGAALVLDVRRADASARPK